MCEHDNIHESAINTSYEEWNNGEGTYVERITYIITCDDCGQIFNKETGRWENG